MDVVDITQHVSTRDVALALGFFDGVHAGHRDVLEATLAAARPAGLESAVFTFRNHPRHVLHPGSGPLLLTTFEERVDLLREAGIEKVYFCDFSLELAAVTPQAFIQEWLVQRLRTRTVTVGPNYRFGHRAGRTPDTLKASGLEVQVVPPLVQEGAVVSSTRIRALVGEGDMPAAAALLTRPFFMSGAVERGDSRGVELGAATANLPVDPSKQHPPMGVYAVWVRHRGETLAGVANFGVRPTFNKADLLLEVHLLDRSLSLYDETLQVGFVQHLRPEQKFATVDALRQQIQRDVEQAREVLSARPAS